MNLPMKELPHQPEIYARLRTGPHPELVSAALKNAYGVEVPPEEIAEYLRTIPETEMAVSKLKEKMGDLVGDPIADIYRLLALKTQRLGEMLEEEELEGKKSRETSLYIDSLIQDEERMVRLLKDIGLNYWGDRLVNQPEPQAPNIFAIVGMMPNKKGEVIEGEYTEQ